MIARIRKMITACRLAVIAATFVVSYLHGATLESEFKQIDKNNDGVIDEKEWTAYRANKTQEKSDSTVIAVSKNERQVQAGAAPSPTPKSLAKRIGEQITIRKTFLAGASDDPESLLPADEGEPARFSWSRSRGESSFYTLDFAVLWHPTINQRTIFDWQQAGSNFLFAWNIEPVFEAHASDKAKAEQNSLTFRIPFTLTLSPAEHQNMPGLGDVVIPNRDAFIKGHQIIASPVYETDRSAHTKTIGGDLYYTPTIIPAFAIGKEAVEGPFSFRWRPYIGLESGHVIDDRGNPTLKNESGYARFSLKLHGELWVQIFAPDQFVVTADYFLRKELIGDNLTHDYWEVSPTLYLDKDHSVSTGLSWKRGSTPPNFEKVDSLVVWVGLKF